jgi:hypothetical protein
MGKSSEKEEAASVMARYPGRIPVICMPTEKSELPPLRKAKFLVPDQMQLHELKYLVHVEIVKAKHSLSLTQSAERTIHFFVGDIACRSSATVGDLYHGEGFLHIAYCEENVLGAFKLQSD